MSRFFSWSFFVDTFPRLCWAIPVTLGITITSFVMGAVFAVAIALVQLKSIPVLRHLAKIYISFMRGTPILIQLFICNLALPGIIWSITGINVGRTMPAIFFVIIAYGLNAAAFLSETFRAAVNGVDAGQHEAALSVGMTWMDGFFHVVSPQALRIALPGFANAFATLLKDTTLAFAAAGVLDLMGTVQAISFATYRYLEAYTGVAIIFLALCLLLEYGTFRLSAWLSKGIFESTRTHAK
jgi:His/Glu/Gln/Arg/opine family amino acid ABC transporter permease subunit